MIIEIANKTFKELSDVELDTIGREGTVLITASSDYNNGKRFVVSRYEIYNLLDGDMAFKAYTNTIELARQVAAWVEVSPLKGLNNE